jgi:hypothetical protein
MRRRGREAGEGTLGYRASSKQQAASTTASGRGSDDGKTGGKGEGERRVRVPWYDAYWLVNMERQHPC